MITTDELVGMTESEEQSPFKLGTVVELFAIGTAKVQFDGEEEPSEKEYSYLASYKPTVGDRVLLASVSGTYVIMGKRMYKEVAGDGSGNFTSLTVDENTKTETLNVASGATIEGATNLNGGVNVKQTAKFNNEVVVTGDVDISGNTRLQDLSCARFAHDSGAYFGVFGRNPTSQKSCNKISESSSLTITIRKLNEMIGILYDYGFFR